MLAALITVFNQWRYVTLAICISALVFTFAIWLPNIELIMLVMFGSAGSLMEKVSFLLSLYGSIGTNFTFVSATYTISIALLFGMNVALLVYYIKRMQGGVTRLGNTSALGISGFVSGLLGIGCAACGTFILSSVLVLFGATGSLALLPLGGEEFGLVGVGLLAFSTFLLLKKMKGPLVCSTN